jgi:hypothetical protein
LTFVPGGNPNVPLNDVDAAVIVDDVNGDEGAAGGGAPNPVMVIVVVALDDGGGIPNGMARAPPAYGGKPGNVGRAEEVEEDGGTVPGWLGGATFMPTVDVT